MIRRPARSHPRYRPSLRRASTRRVSSVCLTSTRSYVRTRTRVCARNSRVHSVSKAPLSMLKGSVMHGLAWSACSCHYTLPELLTSSSRRRRRWWPRRQWCDVALKLSWNTDNHPLLVGGHPDRSPTFLAHAPNTFNQIPHARDSVNAKSPLYATVLHGITRFSRCVAVYLIVNYCWNITLFF